MEEVGLAGQVVGSEDKIRVGVLVETRALGPILEGRVVALMSVGQARAQYPGMRQKLDRWDKLYPDWERGAVALLEFDAPVLTVRLDECPPGFDYGTIRPARFALYPLADLLTVGE